MKVVDNKTLIASCQTVDIAIKRGGEMQGISGSKRQRELVPREIGGKWVLGTDA